MAPREPRDEYQRGHFARVEPRFLNVPGLELGKAWLAAYAAGVAVDAFRAEAAGPKSIDCPRKAQEAPKWPPTSPTKSTGEGIPRDSKPELGSAECAKRFNPAPEGVRRGRYRGPKLRPQTPTSNRLNLVLNLVQYLAPLGSRIP